MTPTRSDSSRNRKRPWTAEVEVGHTAAAPPSKRHGHGGGGGIYVPPYRATADSDATDDSSYERRSCDALRRSITGLGLLCRALLRLQVACSLAFTPVFAALAAIANARLPCVGRLLLARLALRARRAHTTGDKHRLAAAATFVAHLVNQGVAHDLLAVEVTVGLVSHCGAALQESCPRGLQVVFDCLWSVLHDGDVDKHVQARRCELDPEFHLDVFEPSPSFTQDEAVYEDLKRTMLRDDKIQSSSPDDEQTDSDDDDSSETEPAVVVRDQTDTDLINLRRTIYLTVMSSVSSEEVGHKLLSVAGFEACFAGHYSAAHRMTTDELRASARFYAHLLAADALPWHGSLGRVRVTEQDTTSSSLIFIKLLFQDLAEKLGVWTLSKKMNDDDADVRDVLFPRDCARNTRFAINFFTAISLGGITESARKLIV
uniref:Pre-mRNA-splicing factor n=1 Tax=Saccharum hybrid cultivar R570 TaxID=131158 RepID=A0A059PZE5_9POAL|nr:pre-mRNA-splicing factor [Saccharum hybrid cultivar R570]